MRHPPHDVVVRLRNGRLVRLHPATDAHEFQVYAARTYEPGTLCLIDAAVRSGDTFVDVGANLGTISLHAALRAARVIAIEPHPVYSARLRENVDLNAATNIEVKACAAGAKNGTATIYDFSFTGGSSLLDPGSDGTPFCAVDVRPLDDILRSASADCVRLIKIDVEGFEPEVIAGASQTLSQQPIVCMEFDKDRRDSRAYSAHDTLMSIAPFRCYRFRSTKYRASPLVPASRDDLWNMNGDNAVYVTDAARSTMPAEMFG